MQARVKFLATIAFAFLAFADDVRAFEWRFDGVERVVAISDIHGAFGAMLETLQSAEVIGDQHQWVGGEAHLVIVGDILDRGPESRAAMDFLMQLEKEAASAGGQVHVLIGNHESMLLKGDMRYVSDAEYAAFADEETDNERANWLSLFTEFPGVDEVNAADVFEQRFPRGFFAMRKAFRSDGEYGRWLLQKNAVIVINRTAYVHGGLSPLTASIGAEGVNDQLSELLKVRADASPLLGNRRSDDAELLSVDGPLWYRGNIVCQPLVEEHRLDRALQVIDADRVVIGHTPTPARAVQQRFDGKLLQIDTGMLNSHYGGQGSALVIENDKVFVMLQNGDRLASFQQQARRVGQRAAELSTEDVEALLQRGAIGGMEPLNSDRGKKQMRVTVSDGEHTLDAIFSEGAAESVYPATAAYRLDRLLGLNMVPVTVLRSIGGKMGSLQFLPDNVVNEHQRASMANAGGWCPLADQWPLMSVFDSLIYNQGRFREGILYDRSSWKLILADHDRTFAARSGRPRHLENVDLDIHAGWQKALTGLSDWQIDNAMRDVLDFDRIRSLKRRRDELLAMSEANP